jgi:hypothetical protein
MRELAKATGAVREFAQVQVFRASDLPATAP